MCLVAFQKIFRKIFSGVWKRRRKIQIQTNTSHNPEKIINDDRRLRSTAQSRSTVRSRSRLLREIAIDGEISRRRDRDRAVDHDLGSRLTARSSNWKHFRRWWFFFLGYGLCFLDLCFPSSFPNTRKYFPENFLKCNQTHGNIFLFRKLAFPENMYFLENVLQQPNTALVFSHMYLIGRMEKLRDGKLWNY